MSDIVQWLRRVHWRVSGSLGPSVYGEAADEIERLRVENDLHAQRLKDSHDIVDLIADLQDEADELRARVAELEAAQAWRPIETAPKDGTWVLVCGYPAFEDDHEWMHGPVHDTVVAQYTELRNGTKTEGHWQFAWYDGGYYGGVEDVTHWMPLPAPPKEGA